jgi:NitT/TauT family transport system substrate-binding protein
LDKGVGERRKVMRMPRLVVGLVIGLFVGVVGFGREAPPKVVIAYQPGIGYTNLIVVKQQRLLEKRFPGTTFEWRILTSGAAIRDGMIAGQIQVGAGGIGPFLVGWDRGVGWRLLSSLNRMDLWLVTLDPNVRSLRDFKPGMKIGLPAPDSIQAVVLRKGAEVQLRNARALDGNMVAVSHPDGLRLLQAGQLAAHLSAPPFQFQAVEMGGRVILASFALFGVHTFNSVFMLETFYRQYPDFAQALYEAIQQATELINSNPREAARILSEEDQGRVSPEAYLKWLTSPGIEFNTVPRGFLRFATFMKEIGLISKAPRSIDELVFPTLAGKGGN